jgi:hypothetical protein
MTKILFRGGLDENIKNVVKITENHNAVFVNKMMFCFRDKIRKHSKNFFPKLNSKCEFKDFLNIKHFSRGVY